MPKLLTLSASLSLRCLSQQLCTPTPDTAAAPSSASLVSLWRAGTGPEWCHSCTATSQGRSHHALGTGARAEGKPRQPCQPHRAQSRAGQHMLALGQQFIAINQSHSLSVPRCCCSLGLGRGSTARGSSASAVPGTQHHPAHPRPHASVGSAWKQDVPRDTKPELASQAVSIPAEHLYISL